jgi:ubiquinone biosynthesis protein
MQRFFIRRVERGGPLIIKLFQLASIRSSAFPPSMARAVAALRDRTEAVSLEELLGQSGSELPEALRNAKIDRHPVGSGAIGQVHIAQLNRTRIALKLLRPAAVDQLKQQLAVLRTGANWFSKFASLASLPVKESVEHLSTLFGDQLSLRQEADNYRALRRNFLSVPFVKVPRVHEALSSDTCLALEAMDGLRPITEAIDTTNGRHVAAERVLNIVVKMIFWDGLIHCDLHPGNILLDTDGRIVLLDCGLVRSISPATQQSFTEFFRAFVADDGERCARVVEATAYARSRPDLEPAFRQAMRLHVSAAQTARADGFNIGSFIRGVFALTARHGIRCSSEFTGVLLALCFADQVITKLAPDFDFQARARRALGPSSVS